MQKLSLRPLLRAALLAALAFSLPATAAALLDTEHPLVGRLWDMKTRSFLDETTLLERIAPSNVLLLGETHDNPVQHAHQQKLLQARLDAGAQPALLMEQFDSERQSALDDALAGSDRDAALAAAAALAKGWDWPFYRPLVATALERKLPVAAANLSRERMRPVIRQGFAAFDAVELKRLGVEAVWNENRQRYLTQVIEDSHCGKIGAELRDGLVRGQRLRDAVMADTALANLGRGVVGIVGRGHARRDIGLPIYLAARQPAARIYSIAFVEVSADKTTPEAYETERAADGEPFDVLWFTPRAERPDPCAAFGQR